MFVGCVVWCVCCVYLCDEQGLFEIMIVYVDVQCVVDVVVGVIGVDYQLCQQVVFVVVIGDEDLVVVVDCFVKVDEVGWLVVGQVGQFVQVDFQCLVEIMCYYYLIELWVLVLCCFYLYVVEIVCVVDVDVGDCVGVGGQLLYYV